MEAIFQLIGPVLVLVVMSVGFMMIFGVSAERTLGFWNRLLLQPLLRLLAWPFRWLLRQLEAAANRAVQALGRLLAALARASGLGAWWLVRWAGRQLWRGLRWLWRELVYRTRRAYHGRNWRP